jgi:hypothetical protein
MSPLRMIGIIVLRGDIMRTVVYTTEKLQKLFFKKKVLTFDVIKETLGTSVKKTALRKLKSLGYRSSYSHAGRYYTLDIIAQYNEHGLWSYNRIFFSRYDSLINTAKSLIDVSENGYFASELQVLLHVRVYDPLRKLFSTGQVHRRQIGREYLYLSINKWQQQLENRRELIEASAEEKGLYFVSVFDSSDVRHCLPIFLSMLNEKQRRLYVGFESMKLGRGGDAIMSRITGMNVQTIAKGRKDLLAHDIDPERIRKAGAGRPSIKKK